MTSPLLTPTAPVLAYGTSANTGAPLRYKAAEGVRLWGHWISGIGVAAFDLAFFILFIAIVSRFASWDPLAFFLGFRYESRWWGPPAPDLFVVIGEVVRQIWPLVPTAALFFAYGFILRVLAKPVDRDSKGACWAALWMISPWAIVFAVTALGSIVLAIGYGTPLFQSQPESSSGYLLLFLITALSIWLLVITTRTSYRLLSLARSTSAEVIQLEPDSFQEVLNQPSDIASTDPALPKVRTLSYLGRVNTQTRVRQVTARGVLLVGLICTAVSLTMTIGFIIDYLHILVPWGAGINLGAFFDAFGIAANNHPLELILSFALLPGLLIAFLVPLVSRGSTPGCVFCLVFTITLIVALFLAVPALTCLVIFLMEIGLTNPHYARGVWLLLLPVSILAILLLKDIAACLLWIVRHPSLEKAPVPFFVNKT